MDVLSAPAQELLEAGVRTVLAVDHVSVSVATAAALTDISLTVRAGEILGLVGESGAGKSTLLGCIAGRVPLRSGSITVEGRRVIRGRALRNRAIGVVWQAAEQCNNLTIADNLMLGAETRQSARSDYRQRIGAQQLLADLNLTLPDVSLPMTRLTRGERQLVAIARAVRDRPALLLLDDPTFALGASESAEVERLLATLRQRGTAILLMSSDLHQALRLSDRILVLRAGALTAQVDPSVTHVDDLAALIVGEQVATSARRQLLRIQDLADQLSTRGGMTSSLPLILTALGAAIGTNTLCLHVLRGGVAELASSSGLDDAQRALLARVPVGAGPIGRAIGEGVIHQDPGSPRDGDGGCFAVPITGSDGTLGAMTVFTASRQALTADELDLVGLYAGYAATTIERERLLSEITARNRVLETIRSALEVLSGPGVFGEALTEALGVLLDGTGARCVVLCEPGDGARRIRWIHPGAAGTVDPDTEPGDLLPEVADACRQALELLGEPVPRSTDREGAVTFQAPAGRGLLLARWPAQGAGTRDGDTLEDADDKLALLADTAHFLRLAFERQDADRARQEASAARRAEQLQRQFLARLSHELRTPLTAIRGYASSLTQPDVQWDAGSQHSFLTRISDESDRLGRLVGDLLDFSAMESGVLTLHRDWCVLPLVLDAARGCLPAPAAQRVEITTDPDVPAVLADHDRLEQVFVNLIGNAIRHNPLDTRVAVHVASGDGGTVHITVTDDGVGLPLAAGGDAADLGQLRSATSGSGLGLSIVRGIVAAHGGTVAAEPVARGTRWRVVLPEDTPAQDGDET